MNSAYVALYLRISKDRADGAAIERQETECLDRIRRDGHDPAAVVRYEDVDISASGKKDRPAWNRLLADMKAGRVLVVYAWAYDRLTRGLRDFVDFAEIAEAQKLKACLVTGLDLNFTSPEGVAFAHMFTAMAKLELDRMAQRMRSELEQRVRAGINAKASRNTDAECHFAYRQNGDAATLTVNPLGAGQYKSEVTRLLAAGTSKGLLSEFARERNAIGMRTSKGRMWTLQGIRRSLMSATPAGVVESSDHTLTSGGHRKPDYGTRQKIADGNWEPLVSYDRLLAVRSVLEARKAGGRPIAHLLTGILECGGCGHRRYSWAPPTQAGKYPSQRRASTGAKPAMYNCVFKAHVRAGIVTDPDSYTGACTSHRADQLDNEVTRLVLDMLRHSGLRAAFTQPGIDLQALEAERATIENKMADAAAMFATGTRLDRIALERIRAELEPQDDEVNRRISDAIRVSPLEPFAEGKDPESVWQRMSILERRAVAAALIDHITILPGGRSGRPAGWPRGLPYPFNPDRIVVHVAPMAYMPYVEAAGHALGFDSVHVTTGPDPEPGTALTLEKIAPVIQPALLRSIAPLGGAA